MSTTMRIALGVGLLAATCAQLSCSRDDAGRAGVEPSAPTAPPIATAPQGTNSSGTRTAAGSSEAESRTPASSDPVPHDAWRAEGTVRVAAGTTPAASSTPIGGARIDLRLRYGDGREIPLARAQSAADGTFAVALERLASEFEGLDEMRLPAGPRIVARVDAAGHQSLESSMPVARHVERALVFDLRLVEGASVRGRAVDEHGHAAPHATAALSLADDRSGPGGLRLVVEAQADEDGQFALGFATPAKFVLSVRADGIGVDSREVEVEARRDRDVGDVVLKGGPPLAGVALHLDGIPARRLELWAIEGELAFHPDGFSTAVRRTREVERDLGLSWSRTFTDNDGHFEFRGLRPEHYAIKAADERIVIEPRQARFEPGQTNVELIVQTPMLEVRVNDEQGRPAHGAVVECTELGLDSDGTFTPGDTRRMIARGATAAVTFSADPETPLAVRARLGNRASAETIAYFGQGTQHVEQVLILAPRARTGVLRCTVEGVDPASVSVRVAFASPASGQRDEDVGVLDADAQGVVRDAPIGDYKLVADFGGEAGAWCFPWKSAAPVTIAAEGETAVLMQPERGARLAVACEMVGAPPKDFDPATAKRESYGARIVLAPADGANDGRGERTLDLVLGDQGAYLLLPGERAEARDLLPAGDWILRVEGAHWQATRTPIRLTAGKRLSATIELHAR